MNMDMEAGSPHRVVRDACVEAGVPATFLRDDVESWRAVSSRMAYLPVEYSAAYVEYQLAYWAGSIAIADVGIVLHHDDRPCGIWPITAARQADDSWSLGSNGGPLLPPLYAADLPRRSAKALTSRCLAAAHAICRRFGQRSLASLGIYSGSIGLGEWHDRLMLGGATVSLRHDLYLDLSRPADEIKAAFRKSYKPLISSGKRLWKVDVVSSAAAETWNEFRMLHQTVAGKVTRSAASWQAQHEAIAAGDAFFVSLRDGDSRMVGGGLFHVTPHEGLYAVAAYDRSLFDKPLGHVVQCRAVEEMIGRGLRWYRIGARAYRSDRPEPTEKEMTISNFKQGFASHIFPRFLLTHETQSV